MKKKYVSIVSILAASSILAACSSVSAQSSEDQIKSVKSIESVHRVTQILDVNNRDAKIENSTEENFIKAETAKSESKTTDHPEKPIASETKTSSEQVDQSQQQSQDLNTAIVYQGKVLHYGPNFGPLETTNGAAYRAQAFIDTSPWTNIALGWNDVNFNDGVGTYMAGHNQGVFTPLTSLDYGSTIDVYDRNGNKKTFVVKERTHLWNSTGQPSTVTEEVDQMIEKMKVTESLVVQYCLGDDMQLYYLTPID